jgi:hypothetical protein
MVHYFTMVEENGTGNAYKKWKTLKRYKTKTTGPFLIIFWGFNADTLIFNYWEIQQIKFTLKKLDFRWPTPTSTFPSPSRKDCKETSQSQPLTLTYVKLINT